MLSLMRIIVRLKVSQPCICTLESWTLISLCMLILETRIYMNRSIRDQRLIRVDQYERLRKRETELCKDVVSILELAFLALCIKRVDPPSWNQGDRHISQNVTYVYLIISLRVSLTHPNNSVFVWSLFSSSILGLASLICVGQKVPINYSRTRMHNPLDPIACVLLDIRQ